jgi:hypothetical protein
MAPVMLSIGNAFLAALGPYEKWGAMRRLGGGRESVLTNKWFVLMGASIVFILTILLLAIRRLRIEREKEASEEKFDEYANRHGLNKEERKILMGITKRAFVKHKEAVFTMVAAFNRGAAKFMQESFTSGQSLIERKRLNAMVNSVKEKLGFERRIYSFGLRRGRRKGLSSRQIPVGKKVSIALSGGEGQSRINAVVTRNDDLELVVGPEVPVKSVPGKLWNVQYRFGAATWEFNVLTIACGDEELVLNHSDNITFVNRRRFLRVAVEKPALIARFPMTKSAFEGGCMGPEFVEGTVTELSGPGLRIKSDIDISNGDRVLVVFELEEGKLVEDIGEVRGYRDSSEEHSIGVELIGMNDAGVDELVRATNNIAINYAVEDSMEEMEEEESVSAGKKSDG